MAIHPTADIADTATIHPTANVWHHAQVADHVTIGQDCSLGKGVYLGQGTNLGARVKIQNGANVYGATLEPGVMLAPLVCLLEDPAPRATTPDGRRKSADDFQRRPVTVRQGATVAAGALVLPGVVIGRWAMVGAGAVVHHDVADHALVAGNPARQIGWVCRCGHRLDPEPLACTCGDRYQQTPTGLAHLAEPADPIGDRPTP